MENKEPSRDDAAEQDARSVKYQEKAERLLKLHPQKKILAFDTTVLVGIPTVYFLFVTAVAVIGTLAFYRNHHTTSEIFLYASVVLVLVLILAVPIGIFWYVLRAVILKKKPTQDAKGKQSLAARILQNPIGGFLARLGNRPIVRLLVFALPICMIAYAIIGFPQSPRFSLFILVVYTALFVILLTFEIARSLEKALLKDIVTALEHNRTISEVILNVLELLKGVDAKATNAQSIAENLRERHDKLVEAYLETDEKHVAAIVELNRFVRAVANIEESDEAEGDADRNQRTATSTE